MTGPTAIPWVDLHLHTRFSDGSWSPTNLLAEAARLKLAAIAVTDHDTMDGIPETIAARERLLANGQFAPDVIAGVELTCRLDQHEIHILGYFNHNTWQSPLLQQVMAHARHIRRQRGEQIVAKLAQLGFHLPFDAVLDCAGNGTVGRPHVAMAMVKHGLVRNLDEAFTRFLRRGRPAFIDRYRMSSPEAIGHIKRAGGVAVLAHPGIAQIDDRLADLAAQGLTGLEAWHSRHSHSQTRRYRDIAQRLGLIATGGSDCHGTVRGAPLLGTVRVPVECLRSLQQALTTSVQLTPNP